MMDDRIWKLLASRLSGEASPDELKELEKLVKENTDLHHSIDVFTRVWNAPVKEAAGPDVQQLLNRIRIKEIQS